MRSSVTISYCSPGPSTSARSQTHLLYSETSLGPQAPFVPAKRIQPQAERRESYTLFCVAEFVFFYGTLMAGFDRRRRAAMDSKLTFVGRGWINASLFDLGLYPAAVPSPDGCVWGELYELSDSAAVLQALDEIEGYRPGDPDHSLYVRSQVEVIFPSGSAHTAWVYFYNAPLGQAQRIESGDYLQHLRVR